jgi:hypothetical protein
MFKASSNSNTHRPTSSQNKSSRTRDNNYQKKGGWNNNKKRKRPNNENGGGEMCTRCTHRHLKKDCIYNPENPKNILGTRKLATKAKKSHTSNGNKGEEGAHNNAISLVDDNDHNHMGFQEPESPMATKKTKITTGKLPLGNHQTTPTYTDSHHLDCFSIMMPQAARSSPDLTILPSSAFMEHLNYSLGLQSTKDSRKRSRNSGTNPRRDDVNEQRQMEELRCAHKVQAAITNALFNDMEYHDVSMLYASENELIHGSESISQHEIRPGATTPMIIVNIGKIQGIEHKRPLRALVDSGSKRTFIYKSALPLDVETERLKIGLITNLLDRLTTIDQAVKLEEIILPELSATTRIVTPFKAYVAEATTVNFDIILGQDFNIALGINIDNQHRLV